MPLDVYCGGVLRCCLLSLQDYLEHDGPEEENTVVPCKHCGDAMVVAWIRKGHQNQLAWMKLKLRGESHHAS